MPCLAIDGDTAVCNGTRYRLVGFNTPEIHSPACARELAIAQLAKLRLQKFFDRGAYVVHVPCKDGPLDRYNRACGWAITPEGASVADLLIAEGFAHPIWPLAKNFQKKDWCS